MKIICAIIAGAALCGCAANKPMYEWGGYDGMIYQSYKNPEKAEAIRLQLLQHITMLEANKQKVAPGLYADLGTMFLQSGNREQAALYFARERDSWPESAGLMNAMIKTAASNTKLEKKL